MTILTYMLVALAGALIGVGLHVLIRNRSLQAQRHQAEAEARQLTQGAGREVEALIKEAKLEAKEMMLQARAELEREQKETRAELGALERRLVQREEGLDNKVAALDRRESEVQRREEKAAERERALAKAEAACEKLSREHREALEQVAGVTAEEAKKQLMAEIESEARLESAGISKRIIDQARESAEREAREIIARSIQRVTRDYVSEATLSVVPIPNDAMKGRIIGREGRNIRALEAATGIDLIIDETPEAVIISGFDPLRREIAKVSL